MQWLFSAARRLRELGILGMNRRNARCILDHNPRSKYPLVDDKMRMARLCRDIGVPTPAVYAEVASYAALRRLPELLGEHGDFVIKPNHGSAGRGVLVVIGRDGKGYRRHNGEPLAIDDLRHHLSDILSGMYSLGGHPDSALVQQRVRLHPAFAAVTYKGIPDLRIILYRNEPAMAMLRLPTRTPAAGQTCTRAASGPASSWKPASRITPSSTTASSPDTPTPVGRWSACACRSGTTCSRCRAASARRSGWATSASISSSMPATGRCCWKRTPGRGWPSRSPTTAA